VMANHDHLSALELAILAMPVPEGARIQDECPKCGGQEFKKLYFNNNKQHQVRMQCLRADCKHKFQRFSFRKSHPEGYKKAKGMEPEEYVGLVKVCSWCGGSNAKFYGINNKDVQQARYKCLNSECKKLFTPFSKPRANAKQSATTESPAVAGSQFLDRPNIMNSNLQHPITPDPQYLTSRDSFVSHVVDSSMLEPRAHHAFREYNIDEDIRAKLAPLFANLYHDQSVQQAGPVVNINVWPTPARPWNTQSEDHGAWTTLMPPTPTTELQEVCESEDHVPTVAAPNLTPTTILQEEEQTNIVHDAPSTTVPSTSLGEHQGSEWSIPADFEYWNEMMNTDLSSLTTNDVDTLSLEQEFDAEAYLSSLLTQ
jgi:hypothetical protein